MFHFFTVWRLRIFILIHTLFLSTVIIVTHLLVWP
jgi:hypothetical protein